MKGPVTTLINPETQEEKEFAFDYSYWSHDGFETDDTGYNESVPGTSKYGATVTPEVVLVDDKGTVRYQGRIDNSYARVGKRRTRTTSSELKDALKAVTSGKPVKTPAVPAIGCIIERPKNP